VLLLVKVRNAGELLWDSLDAQERRVLVCAAVYAVAALVSLVQRRQVDRRRAELVAVVRSEMASAAADGNG
jgi:hypothetical protein